MLQGSLENFALDEVLGLLAGTSKTGQLEIAGNRGTGVLSFDGGRLVDATASYTANGSTLEDVMFELLRYTDGTFCFNSGEVAPAGNPENVANVLAAAESRLRDWRSIEAMVPSLEHQVAPVPELPGDEVTINRQEWAALTVISSGCPVSMVCDRLQLGEVEGSRQIKNLAERDLVTVNEPIGGYTPLAASATPAESVPSALAPPEPIGFSSPSTSPAVPAPAVIEDSTTDLGDLMSPTADPLGVGSGSDAMAGLVASDRPPMPPAPVASDLETEISAPTTPPAPPSPAEISSFGEDINDASELVTDSEEAKGGGLLARYLKSDD